jgi:hypothetical protein
MLIRRGSPRRSPSSPFTIGETILVIFQTTDSELENLKEASKTERTTSAIIVKKLAEL